MSNTIFCVKYKEERKALEKAPSSGRMGELALSNLSVDGWKLWLKIQVILMNEMRISTSDNRSIDFIFDEFKKFLESDSLEREYLEKLRLQVDELPKHLT